MYYIILDMEWNQAFDRAHTVTDPVILRGEIIQIGAVKCDENFNYVDKLKINVAPKYYKKMNHHVEKITGITNAMLPMGESFPQAFAQLKRWCSPEFRFITWGFDDLPMLSDNLRLHGLDSTFGEDYINLQLIYKNQIDNERDQWSLEAAVERLGIPPDARPHDAMNDAWFTYEVCRRLDMKKGIAEYSSMHTGLRRVLSREIFRNQAGDKKIILSEAVVTIPCPECGETLSNGRWLTRCANKRINICTCARHGEYLVKVEYRHTADDKWMAVRSVYKSDDAAKQSYQRKIEKNLAFLLKKEAKGKENINADNDTV